MRTNADAATDASLLLREFCFLSDDCSVYNKPQDYPRLIRRHANAAIRGQALVQKAKIDVGSIGRCYGHARVCSCAKAIFAQKEYVCIQEGESRKARALKFLQNESNARCVLPYVQRL